MSKDRFFSGGGQSEIDALKSELNSQILLASGTPTNANEWQTFNLPTGYHISDFRFIISMLAQYGNTYASIIEPRPLFESHANQTNRVILNHESWIVYIYKQSDTSVGVLQSNLGNGFGFRLYGIL